MSMKCLFLYLFQFPHSLPIFQTAVHFNCSSQGFLFQVRISPSANGRTYESGLVPSQCMVLTTIILHTNFSKQFSFYVKIGLCETASCPLLTDFFF